MNNNEELESWVRLWRVSGIGSKKFQLLLNYFDSPSKVFSANSSQITKAGISLKDANSIIEQKTAHQNFQNSLQHADDVVKQDLDWLAASDQHHIITLNCPAYPQRLKQINDAPALLYVHGNLSILNDPQLGIVGSRNPTQGGHNNAYEFAKHLATTGLCITSGLALGIDGAAHQGAIDGNGPTIAVIATGIDRVYPAKHRELAHKIVENGAIISEFPVGTHPDSRHFPRRNRIISALSYGVLVVEAALKSGSLITARLAMEQNREVFAIPGSIHNPLAKGCHQLIRQGAKLVETAEDILEEMSSVIDLNDHSFNSNSQSEQSSLGNKSDTTTNHLKNTAENNTSNEMASSDAHIESNIDRKNSLELDSEQIELLNAMGFDPISIDQLVLATDLDAASIAAMLLILELQNYIASNGGGTYTRLK
ncbi:MAG: DNA processing protein [Cocleimonas sp.]|jgi:DNA processing protein